MARFDSSLRVEKRLYKEKCRFFGFTRWRKRQFWVTLEPFIFYSDDESIYMVPEEFRTDFSSVPWLFTLFVPKDDIDSQAAVLHDYLYHVNKPKSVVTLPPGVKKISRGRCDMLFLLAMQVCGQTLVKRRAKYRAVRLGGWHGWNRRDKEIIRVIKEG